MRLQCSYTNNFGTYDIDIDIQTACIVFLCKHSFLLSVCYCSFSSSLFTLTGALGGDQPGSGGHPPPLWEVADALRGW